MSVERTRISRVDYRDCQRISATAWCVSVTSCMPALLTAKGCLYNCGSGPPPNTWFLGWSHTNLPSKGISIGSSVFAGLTGVRRHSTTKHATPVAAMAHQYGPYAMRPNSIGLITLLSHLPSRVGFRFQCEFRFRFKKTETRCKAFESKA